MKPGEDATLQCHSSRDVEVLKWIRLDLKSHGSVSIFKQDLFNEEFQHQSFHGRVVLKDPEMKDGDASVILKNVNINDVGIYECRIGSTGSKLELISIISLKVQDSGEFVHVNL